MKKIIIAMCFIIAVLILIGCRESTNDMRADVSVDTLKDDSSEKETEAEESQIYIGAAKAKNFDYDAVQNLFPNMKNVDMSEKGNKAVSQSGDVLYVNDTSIYYSSSESSISGVVGNLIKTDKNYSSYNLDHFLGDEIFGFNSAENILTEFEKLLNELKIEEDYHIEIYSLPHESLSIEMEEYKNNQLIGLKEELAILESKKDEKNITYFQNLIAELENISTDGWGDDYDCYMVIAYPELNGSLFSNNIITKTSLDRAFEPGSIKAFYSKDGLINLELLNLLEISEMQETDIISESDAISIFNNHFESIITTSTNEIVDCALKYYTYYSDDNLSAITISPYWEIDYSMTLIDDKSGEEIIMYTEMSIDAIDGMELVSDSM